MKIFVIYKNEDYNKVTEVIKSFRNVSPDVQVSVQRQSKQWKKLAKRYIRCADLVIYLAGTKYSENIDWEINCAIQLGQKVYCVKLDNDIELSDARLYKTDSFDLDSKSLKIEKPVSLDVMLKFIKGDSYELQTKLFSNNIDDDTLLIEQYKLLLSTSESLIERRQKLTTTYISIFSVLLPIISTMLSLSYFYLYAGAMIISVIAIVLCISWRATIISYGKSNRAKFAILEEMERKMPAAMFASEWYALGSITKKYKSFTSRETAIPLLFIFVYSIFFIISLIFFIQACIK